MNLNSKNDSTFRIGVDTGGTFTDVAGWVDGAFRSWKLSSTPSAYEKAVLEGARQVSGGEAVQWIHSTTVATNALLERKGAKTALITTAGFRDVLEIGRQNRPDLYALCPQRPLPLIPRERRFEIRERVTSEGKIEVPLDASAFPEILSQIKASGAEAVAVVFLFSFLCPEHEQQVGRWLREEGFRVSLSHEILPEFREYERSSTTVVNAYVQPAMSTYLSVLEARANVENLQGLQIMQSNGGTISPRQAGDGAVNTLLSGPAAGLKGAMKVAEASDLLSNLQLITFDMGGTSTDVSLLDGEIRLSTELQIESFPVGVPMVDVHTVGAGGGSVARMDAGGALQVGPESAGAHPGPAAYGAGGPPTVTDAHVVLGNVRAENFLQGRMTLDEDAARREMESLGGQMGECSAEEAAAGVIRLVNLHMENAIRVISVQRGYDPSSFTLMGFGGAGGLHVFALAEALGIPQVMVPCHPGVLSGLGAAVSPFRRERSHTLMEKWRDLSIDELRTVTDGMREKLAEEMKGAGEISTRLRLDMRYVGQSHELSVPLDEKDLSSAAQQFHALHAQRYGHAEPEMETEVVTLRLQGEGPAPVAELPVLDFRKAGDPVAEIREGEYLRKYLKRGDQVKGPCRIFEDFHTVWLPEGWQVKVDQVGNLLGSRCGGEG
ncbi:hydantoinase/oxoprolinase family protein [Kiritimatiellaeota bacterium B1221]|nr:hydantoinase/oxoprolinase family protein [Kiritimatiellaeota bacterium B1221]